VSPSLAAVETGTRGSAPLRGFAPAGLREGAFGLKAFGVSSMRFLPASILLLALTWPAAAFVPGELVRATRGEMLQFQGRDFVGSAKGQEFVVLQHEAGRGLVFVPFVKADGSTVAVTLPPDAVEALPPDGWRDLLAGAEAFRDGRADAARQFIARAAQDEKYKPLATALAPRLQAAATTRSATALQTLRETAVQLDKLGHQSLALAIDEGTDRLGGATAPPSKVNRDDLKKRVTVSTRAVARARQAIALRCLTNADQEIRAGLEAEPARPELQAMQGKVQKDLEEATRKGADADRMRRVTKGTPHALTALDMGLKLCVDHPQLIALKKELASAFEERTSPPVTPAFLAAAGGGDARILAEGHALYTNRCTECHDLELVDSRTVSSWQRTIASMSRRAGVNAEQQARMLEYITAAIKVVEKMPAD